MFVPTTLIDHGPVATTAPARASQYSLLNWFAVHTRSNFEKAVSAELSAKGLDVFLPTFRQVRQWKDRKKAIDFPVFPGYLFVRMTDSNESRLDVLRTSGTVRILGASGKIEPVPDAEIESIHTLLNSNQPFFTHPFIREGAWVRVRFGPLKNLEGLLVRVKSDTRLVLSIELLSQSVAAEIEVNDFEVLRAPISR